MSPHDDARAFAIGEVEFERRLHHEHALAVSAPEAWRYATYLAETTEAELEALAAAVEPGLPWRAVVEASYETTLEMPRAPDAAVAGLAVDLARARDLVAADGLASIAPGALAILPFPQFLEPLVGDGFYRPAPFRQGSGSAILFAHRDLTPAASRTLAITRGYPGQHLHRLAAEALNPQVRRRVAASVTVEGWALYATDVMADTEWVTDPVDRLHDRVEFFRAVVLASVDVGLHTRQWTIEEGEHYLRTRVPGPGARARADMRRTCLEPTRALSAALGRRELLRLRDDARSRGGSAWSASAFHDAVLGYGGLPVSLIRWGMGLDA